jgi:3-oxoacyl-[acyl-carrier-protein] synthase II
MAKNVVVTGEGIVSAIGLNKQSVFSSLKEGKTGIGTMHFLNSAHTELPVGEVKLSNDEMKGFLGLSQDMIMSRTALMGIMAVEQATKEAHLDKQLTDSKSLRVVLISGTTVGGMDITENYYSELLKDDRYLDCLKQHDCGGCTQVMANFFDFITDYTTISTACSSAANAIILGANLIKDGQADIVIAGGTEALSRFHLNGFNSLMILDKENCRPFDKNRAGLNLGEGAGFVVLESEELATERGLEIHAYLNGYGNKCDSFHQTASSDNGEGAFLAMTEAIEMAKLQAYDIDYVNAHGTGTPNNDLSESHALNRVFGQRQPLISSTKSFTGHTTSASGGIEAVICLLSLQHNFVPANLGWKERIEDGIEPTLGCEYKELSHVLCNSFGFGGNDSSLLFSKFSTHPDNPFEGKEVEYKILSQVDITDTSQLYDIKTFVKPLEVRRMGTLMKSSLLSSLKALQEAGIEKPDAIIAGTWMGCLENSEKILEQIESEGEQSVKPTIFMQSTHNTIGSNIAIRTVCHGYNVTYTQQDKSLDWALVDAKLLLKSGKARNVLVGLYDETTPTYGALMDRIGFVNLPKLTSISIVLSCGN